MPISAGTSPTRYQALPRPLTTSAPTLSMPSVEKRRATCAATSSGCARPSRTTNPGRAPSQAPAASKCTTSNTIWIRGPAAACPAHASVARYAAATRIAPNARRTRCRWLADRPIASSSAPSATAKPKRETQRRPNTVPPNTRPMASSLIACAMGMPLMRAISTASQVTPEMTLAASAHAPDARASDRSPSVRSRSRAAGVAPDRRRDGNREQQLAKQQHRRGEMDSPRCDDHGVHRGKRALISGARLTARYRK